jgi:hypothetical protein
MAAVETILAIDQEALDQAEASYRELGFRDVGCLISAAVVSYLEQASPRVRDERLEGLRRAASDPQYLRVLREISEDFAEIDAEGLPPKY